MGAGLGNVTTNMPMQATFESSRNDATGELEFEQEALTKRHSMTHEAVQTGEQAGAYRTVLTHFSQRYPKIPVVDSTFLESTCIAFDLMSVNLKGDFHIITPSMTGSRLSETHLRRRVRLSEARGLDHQTCVSDPSN